MKTRQNLKHLSVVCFICYVSLHGFTAIAAPNMQAGLWEITTKSEMAGMPAGMPPVTVKQCVRPSDLGDPKKVLPQGSKECQVNDYKLQGNSASWRMECSGATQMSGAGNVTFSGASYSGNMKVTLKAGKSNPAMTMSQTFSARRIGDCK